MIGTVVEVSLPKIVVEIVLRVDIIKTDGHQLVGDIDLIKK